jgi:hypothetical protein
MVMTLNATASQSQQKVSDGGFWISAVIEALPEEEAEQAVW